MAHAFPTCFLAALLLAGSASAATVGAIQGKPVVGRPLEVNVPFSVDDPAERACASANVRYGNGPVAPSTLHVQGRGLKRNLLVTSRGNVSDRAVTVQVRVGCGTRAVSRKFVMAAGFAAARSLPVAEPASRRVAAAVVPVKQPGPRPVDQAAPGDPLFPPAEAAAVVQSPEVPRADPATLEELRKARAEAATAIAQRDATRKELAALLDVERRTAQTLINADHQVREAKAESARMHAVLNWVGAALGLGAAGLVWFEVQRVLSRRRATRVATPQQEPTILAGAEMPA